MEDESEITAAGNCTGHRKDNDNPVRVKDKRGSDGLVDITSLIRSLQRSEGNPDCFDNNQGTCEQLDCTWRTYCLEGHLTPE